MRLFSEKLEKVYETRRAFLNALFERDAEIRDKLTDAERKIDSKSFESYDECINVCRDCKNFSNELYEICLLMDYVLSFFTEEDEDVE